MSEVIELGEIKSTTNDFLVTELLDIDFTYQGEHHWVYVRKENLHTEEVAKILAKFVGIASKNVGFSGMKDKYAITEQWFSLYMPGLKVPEWRKFDHQGIDILKSVQHQKKLRKKLHYGNQFSVVIRNVTTEYPSLIKAIHKIKTKGVPNYYGSQRFGYDHSNVKQLIQWLNNEINPPLKRKKWLLSVYRSFLFNHYLTYRINKNKLHEVLVGDIMQFDHSNSVYLVTENDLNKAKMRFEDHQAYPTGPLWGEASQLNYQDKAQMLLNEAFETLDPIWLNPSVLKPFNLTLDYRKLILMPQKLTAEYSLNNQLLKLNFILPAGGYATTVLDHLGELLKDLS